MDELKINGQRSDEAPRWAIARKSVLVLAAQNHTSARSPVFHFPKSVFLHRYKHEMRRGIGVFLQGDHDEGKVRTSLQNQ